MTRILLIRHAMTDANGRCIAGRAAGVRLNAEGRRQAQSLAERLAGWPIAAIYSSPLDRALETAAPVARLLGLDVVAREDFQEIDFGEWTGQTLEELGGDPRFRRFNAFRSGAPVPGGETMLQVQARMLRGLDALRGAHPQACVAVFGHGDPIRAALAYCAGMPLDLLQRLEAAPASVNAVEIGDEAVRLLCVNDIGGRAPPWEA